jgi:hypothetical protein
MCNGTGIFCHKQLEFRKFHVILSPKNDYMAKKELDKLFFLSFCIENYKQATDTEGINVVELFDKYNIMEHLNDNYEVLHTQNAHWLMEEIDDFIKSKQEVSV